MRPRTVLVVTQNPAVRAIVKSLERPDVRAIWAATGIGALLVCAAEPVDLIVMDRATPGMDTSRLADKLSSAFPGLPVIEPAALAETLDAPCRKQPGLAYAGDAVRDQRRA